MRSEAKRLLRRTGLSLLFLACLGTTIGLADRVPADKSKEDRDAWMAVKLAASQEILAHLTAGDFEKLEENARRMQVVNYLEQWLRSEDFKNQSGYKGQLHAFEFATRELVRHAEDRNTNGALKSFQLLTESCVRCHQLIRDPVE